MTDQTVTVHIEGVPLSSITDALLAIEAYDERNKAYHERNKGTTWYEASHKDLTALVLGLRACADEALGFT